MPAKLRECPECGGASLYVASVESAGATGPVLLPGLGTFLSYAKMQVVLCRDCGLLRFYASEAARSRVAGSAVWQGISSSNS